jgi:hypothetical protein
MLQWRNVRDVGCQSTLTFSAPGSLCLDITCFPSSRVVVYIYVYMPSGLPKSSSKVKVFTCLDRNTYFCLFP